LLSNYVSKIKNLKRKTKSHNSKLKTFLMQHITGKV